MSVRSGLVRWLALLSSLGLMVVLATIFQLELPRLRSEWIATAIDEHNLVMQGTAGSPWQYRLLSDYLFELVMRVLAAGSRDAYQYRVYAFVLFRGAQLVCIFGLGFVYFRKLGLSAIASVIGLGIVCTAMVVGQIETNWQLDVYTDVVLYLLAAIFALSGHFQLIIPLAVLAALNRETGVFIPLIPLGFVNVRALRCAQNRAIYRAAGIGLALFVLVRIGVHVGLPSQDMSTRLVADGLMHTLRIRGGYAYLAVAVAAVPVIGAFGVRDSAPIVRFLFWLIVPVWMATHSWGNVAVTPIAFLVPLVLVGVPSGLFTLTALRRKTEGLFGSAVSRDRLAGWETLAAVGVVSVLGPVAAGVLRLNYPFPLERIEAPMLQEVRRVMLGLPLYAAPTLDYVPLLYAPVYVYVSAAVATLTGVGLLPLRLVSLAAALGSALLVYLLVSRDAPGRLSGVLAASLFLGTTQITPTDRFPARVDELCTFLVLAAIYAARRAESQPHPRPRLSVVCGLLIGVAILTKQTAAVAGLALLVPGVTQVRARLVPYLAATGATLAVGAVALLAAFDGWARFYLVDLPRNHGVLWPMLAGFWTQFLLPQLWVACVAGVAFFVIRARERDYATVRFYACATAGLLGISWVGVMNPGGGANSLPAAYAAIAILFGLGVGTSVELARARFARSRALAMGLLTAAGLAFACLQYSEDRPAPLRANAQAGQRLVGAIAALPGPVFATEMGIFQLRAGKTEHAFSASWAELVGAYGGTTLPEGRQFVDALDQALSRRQYAYVLVDPEGFDPGLIQMLGSHGYELVGPLIARDDLFYRWRIGFSSGGGYLTPSPNLYAPRHRTE